MDFIPACIAFLFLLPFFLIIMVALKFTGEGEIFYAQERLGYKNNPFGILKFATMLKNSLNIGSKTITTRNDPRITPIGKWLRLTKLNELPQIINVLKGDMSIVGPRPLLLTSFQKYKKEVQEVLYENKPGITGIGSLVFRDEEALVTEVRNKGLDPMEYYKRYIYPYKGELELWYHKNISFKTDIIILFLTFWSIINKRSALVFKLFTKLPPKPYELTIAGIHKLSF